MTALPNATFDDMQTFVSTIMRVIKDGASTPGKAGTWRPLNAEQLAQTDLQSEQTYYDEERPEEDETNRKHSDQSLDWMTKIHRAVAMREPFESGAPLPSDAFLSVGERQMPTWEAISALLQGFDPTTPVPSPWKTGIVLNVGFGADFTPEPANPETGRQRPSTSPSSHHQRPLQGAF
jgi:hypothetical protein